MCKFEREGKMPIIFDDDSQMFLIQDLLMS